MADVERHDATLNMVIMGKHELIENGSNFACSKEIEVETFKINAMVYQLKILILIFYLGHYRK